MFSLFQAALYCATDCRLYGLCENEDYVEAYCSGNFLYFGADLIFYSLFFFLLKLFDFVIIYTNNADNFFNAHVPISLSDISREIIATLLVIEDTKILQSIVLFL